MRCRMIRFISYLVFLHLSQLSNGSILFDQINPDPAQLKETVVDLQKTHTMIFINSQLDKVSKDFFVQFSYLTTISVTSCDIRELPSFQYLVALQYADLSNNWIEIVREQAFKDCRRLQELDLSDNEIKEVHKDAFQGLENLEILDLSSNRITSLDRSVLRSLATVRRINLRSNGLRVLDMNMFSETRNLTILSLEDNGIDQVVAATSRPSGLTHLYLRKNRIVEMKALSSVFYNLAHLDLSDNSDLIVSPEPFKMLKNLQYLGLDGVDLDEKLDHLQPLHNLVELSIAHVGLTSNFVDPLPQLGRLERLNVEDNNLGEINYIGLREKLPELKLIGLNMNAFNCSYLEKMVRHFENREIFMDFWRKDAGDVDQEMYNGVQCLRPKAAKNIFTWVYVVVTGCVMLLFIAGLGYWYFYRARAIQIRSYNYELVYEEMKPKYFENPNFEEE